MKKGKYKVVRRTAMIVISAMVLVTAFLFLWIHAAEKEAHYTPNYSKVDIAPYLEKEELTKEEYTLLYRQTGLSKTAVDTLRKENRVEEILAVQERFFAEVEIDCEGDFLLFREIIEEPIKESIDMSVSIRSDVWKGRDTQNSIIPVLEDGDILITFNSHFLGWRNGHAAIVIDAEKGLTLEALTLGENSAILSINSWAKRPSFAVLRLSSLSKEQREEIADYAKENLVELPYHLTAGIFGEISGTQCAHLVWYAYQHFGYDLDSDGGVIVTPRDLYDSPMLETVQVYGMENGKE